MNKNTSNDSRKTLSILCHASILFSSTVISIGIPIAILLVSEDTVVKTNAKEALNFWITACILAVIFSILSFIIIGFPLLILLLIATLVMPIMAIIKVLENPDRSYRYPLIWHPL